MPRISQCCLAFAPTDGDDKDGTHYHYCSICDKPCDTWDEASYKAGVEHWLGRKTLAEPQAPINLDELPFVEIPEHEKICGARGCGTHPCTSSCPACAVEKANKAWAKWLVGNDNFQSNHPGMRIVYIPISDWQQIRRLAEEQ